MQRHAPICSFNSLVEREFHFMSILFLCQQATAGAAGLIIFFRFLAIAGELLSGILTAGVFFMLAGVRCGAYRQHSVRAGGWVASRDGKQQAGQKESKRENAAEARWAAGRSACAKARSAN